MRPCKSCNEPHTHGAMLTTGVCVFCHYKTHEWEMNGQQTTEKEDIIEAKNLMAIFKENKKSKVKTMAIDTYDKAKITFAPGYNPGGWLRISHIRKGEKFKTQTNIYLTPKDILNLIFEILKGIIV